MKNRNFKIGALLVSLFAASCSPALYQSGTYNIDDMYAEHDVTRIAQEKQAIAEARKAEAEAHRAEIEARQAEAAYYASDDSYQGGLADTYESAYARRLRGFSSPTYQMPTSYFNLRYNGTYQFVSAYDPAVYNIIVMGDEVWVEPKYITSMFGTWGSPSIVSFGWSAGLYNDWYFSWGYNPYPWAYPGFGWPYYSYNPYWGYPYWGGYYPYWGYYPGWGGGHHHHPYPPHHRLCSLSNCFPGRSCCCLRTKDCGNRQRRSFPPLLSRTPETKKQLNDFCYETSRNFGAAFSGLVRNRPGVGSKLRRFIDGP